MRKFSDIDLVRQTIKDGMRLDEFIQLADNKYAAMTGQKSSQIEQVSATLYKKRCDLNEHPMDADGTRDSTASFTITPDKELWYCFGCGAGGDRFEYISRKFNVDHIEAITIAAEIENIDLTNFYEDVSEQDRIIDNLFKENDQAREIAHAALLADEQALLYLRGRGITDESIDLFRLGFAPPINVRISQFDSIPNQVVLQLDRREQFNNAILFPITDVHGRMRYFQSRPFEPMTGMKYIGGNDNHPLYNETDRIFGLHIAKKNLYKSGGVLVGVEGAPDTIACVQAGITACGFLGTVVNQLTFDLLDKYRVTELILLLDGDKAGRDRSFKIAEKYLSLQTKVRLRIASLPDGYDPDDYINKYGGDELKKVIAAAPYAIQYLIDSKWNEAITPTDKISFMNSIKPYMTAIHDKIVRNIMINHIAGKVGLDPMQIEDYYVQSMVATAGVNLFSPEGEEILLGEVLRNPNFITELSMRFRDDDWCLLRHKYLFRILKEAEYTDIESLFVIAKNLNIGDIIQFDWLSKLYNKHGNVEFSMRDVEDKLMRRKSMDIVDKAKVSASDMTQDIVVSLDRVTNDIFGVMHKRMDEQIFDSKQQVSSVMKLVHERMLNGNKLIGRSHGSGFSKLDVATLGIQPKTLTVVAANQSVGKTMLCENWAMSQAIYEQVPTLWFSLEMDVDRMSFRNLAILSGVPSTNIMTGNLTPDQKALVDNAAIMLERAPFYLSERGHDLSESLAIAKRYVMRHNTRLIYMDYAQLQYVSDRKTDQRHRELGWISKSWKEFAKDMDVSVILISQLSKEALKAEIAQAEHGAGSYEIAQDADTYITLKEKSEEEINQRGIENGNITMNVAKNRMGEKEILIDIYADYPIQRMSECQ